MQLAFQNFLRRQFCEILTNPDTSLIEPKQGDALLSAFGAKDQSERGVFAGLLFILFQPAEIKLHLALVGGFELAEFQLDRDQPPQATMIEEQVKSVVFAIDDHSFLTRNETEPDIGTENTQVTDTENA